MPIAGRIVIFQPYLTRLDDLKGNPDIYGLAMHSISNWHPTFFTKTLLHWHDTVNQREMPWKGEKDPYRVWLSEIILQQTQVKQGLPYYERFLDRYPTVTHLADAPDSEVFKLWEGLGYYSRCRNLLAAARQVVQDHAGRFPANYAALLGLKGVGPYTAAAIASFAFGLPHAVTDGNVVRILARFYGQTLPFDTTGGQKWFRQKAQELLPPHQPAAFNQAIMDFGATVCKPQNPLCHDCPLRPQCVGYKNEMVTELPVKSKKIEKKTRHFTIIIIKGPKGWLVRERVEKDIWRHLYEFVVIEGLSDKNPTKKTITKMAKKAAGLDVELESVSQIREQQLTHQKIIARFAFCTSQQKSQVDGYQWVNRKFLKTLAFPRLMKELVNQLGG